MSISMAPSGGVCRSFIQELLTGVHDVTTDAIKCALFAYDNDARPTNTFSVETTAYTSANEVTGAGYTAGGTAVTVTGLTRVGTGWAVQLADIEFPDCTVSATQALIYNSTKANRAIAWLRFGALQTTASRPFIIRWDATRPPLIRFEV